MRGGGWRAAHFSGSAGIEFCVCTFGTITPKERLHGSENAGIEFCACRYGTMREVFGGTGSRFARSRRGRAAWEPRRPASPPCGPAVRTGDPVSRGPCALVAAVSAHGPSGTARPVRTARPRPSRQSARSAVGAGPASARDFTQTAHARPGCVRYGSDAGSHGFPNGPRSALLCAERDPCRQRPLSWARRLFRAA